MISKLSAMRTVGSTRSRSLDLDIPGLSMVCIVSDSKEEPGTTTAMGRMLLYNLLIGIALLL